MESPKQKEIIDLNSHFCIEMANHVLLKEAEKGSNFVVSPSSFQVMLSLIAMGSTGRTLEQLLFYLRSKNIQQLKSLCSQIVSITTKLHGDHGNNLAAGPLVTFVNGAWVDQSFGLKPSFEAILKDVYKAEAKGVDFANKADQVVEEVNLWAEDATKGLIKELLPSRSLDSDTALVFSNALYFKGAWDRKFDSSKTMHKDFHLVNGQIVQIPFMTSKKDERHFYHNGYDCDYKILKIPYQNGHDTRREFSMYFFLPHERNCLLNLVRKFNSIPRFFNQDFKLWEEDLPDFWIPKFKFSFEFEASETVEELGLQLPFTSTGEFTEMVDSPHTDKLRLSKIFHKSYIEVNEEGTEAAASTALVMRWRCATYPTPSFVADHPFMFMIREETCRLVFFIGAVLDPLLVN